MQIGINGTYIPVSELSFLQWRQFMAEFMSTNPNSHLAWDIMGCVRGPDSPSERPDMGSKERSKAYKGRRDRKFKTVEILREAMFFGAVGGAARYHKDNKVTIPPSSQRDHFDRHVERGANAIGIPVEVEKEGSTTERDYDLD